MAITLGSPEYRHWAGYVTQLIREAAHEHPLADGNLWAVIAHLDWPNRGPEAGPVAARLLELAPAQSTLSRLALLGQTAVAVYDKRNDIEWVLEQSIGEALVEAIPSEDGLDDFHFHLVGMGQAFYEGLEHDPKPALELARRGDHHESLRYVFEAAVEQLPYAETLVGLREMFEIATLADVGAVEPPTPIDLGGDVIGVVVRRDARSILVIVPDGERTIQTS